MQTRSRLIGVAALSLALLGGMPSAHAVDLVGFNVSSTYSIVGSIGSVTEPTPLVLMLSGPALADTFVGISTSNAAFASVPGGGVTFASGQSAVQVPVTALGLGDATLTAQFNGVEFAATVSVVSGIPAVPEPATAAMFALGLAVASVAGALERSRRRGKDKQHCGRLAGLLAA